MTVARRIDIFRHPMCCALCCSLRVVSNASRTVASQAIAQGIEECTVTGEEAQRSWAEAKADIAGITCNYECLAEQAPVPESMAPGDTIAFLNTGSYIEVYTCNFNALPRPGTVLVSGDQAEWVKRPETLDDVFQRDIVPERLEAV